MNLLVRDAFGFCRFARNFVFEQHQSAMLTERPVLDAACKRVFLRDFVTPLIQEALDVKNGCVLFHAIL
jgi:hypothetical protein